MTVNGGEAKEALQLSGFHNLENKTVIDASSPIVKAYLNPDLDHFFTGMNNSLMEQLQLLVPKANFVKAFHSFDYILCSEIINSDSKPTMFLCGNNSQAKEQVIRIIRLFGYEPADIGTVEAARSIESLNVFWSISGYIEMNLNHSFQLQKN